MDADPRRNTPASRRGTGLKKIVTGQGPPGPGDPIPRAVDPRERTDEPAPGSRLSDRPAGAREGTLRQRARQRLVQRTGRPATADACRSAPNCRCSTRSVDRRSSPRSNTRQWRRAPDQKHGSAPANSRTNRSSIHCRSFGTDRNTVRPIADEPTMATARTATARCRYRPYKADSMARSMIVGAAGGPAHVRAG